MTWIITHIIIHTSCYCRIIFLVYQTGPNEVPPSVSCVYESCMVVKSRGQTWLWQWKKQLELLDVCFLMAIYKVAVILQRIPLRQYNCLHTHTHTHTHNPSLIQPVYLWYSIRPPSMSEDIGRWCGNRPLGAAVSVLLWGTGMADGRKHLPLIPRVPIPNLNPNLRVNA